MRPRRVLPPVRPSVLPPFVARNLRDGRFRVLAAALVLALAALVAPPGPRQPL